MCEIDNIGIRVLNIPWYIRCPVINRFFNTCLIRIRVTSFDSCRDPVVRVSKEFRVPFEDRKMDIFFYLNAEVDLSFEGRWNERYGAFAKIDLIEVNHHSVYDTGCFESKHPLSTGCEILAEGIPLPANRRFSAPMVVKFGKRDFKKAGNK